MAVSSHANHNLNAPAAAPFIHSHQYRFCTCCKWLALRPPDSRLINFIGSKRRSQVVDVYVQQSRSRAKSVPAVGSAVPLSDPSRKQQQQQQGMEEATFMSKSDIETCRWLQPACSSSASENVNVDVNADDTIATAQLPQGSQHPPDDDVDAGQHSRSRSAATFATSSNNNYGHQHSNTLLNRENRNAASAAAISSAYGCCFGPNYATSTSTTASLNSTTTAAAVSLDFDFQGHGQQQASNYDDRVVDPTTLLLLQPWQRGTENGIEKVIFNFRFFSLLAVGGSLVGAFLCFLKGCVYIIDSYTAFYHMCSKGMHTGMVVLRLVEAVDVYLTGTVMLIFGMGLYGLFISNVSNNLPPHEDRALRNSSLFGMFVLQKRPKWMRIASLDELKSKLGHVVVMILLVKMFERSKAICIATSFDLLTYSICIFLISSALLVLRNLSHHN